MDGLYYIYTLQKKRTSYKNCFGELIFWLSAVVPLFLDCLKK